MAWVFLVVGALVVFAIAAAFVGSEAFRLGHETPAAIFDVDEATEVVADALTEEAQGRLTYAEVRRVILAAIDHLHDKGITALPGEAIQRPDHDVVVDDAVAIAAALVAVDDAELDVSDEDAALIVRHLLEHLSAIGALGPRA